MTISAPSGLCHVRQFTRAWLSIALRRENWRRRAGLPCGGAVARMKGTSLSERGMTTGRN